MAEAKNHAETYHRHGEARSTEWKEAQSVTGRKPDEAPENSSFASRAKRGAAENKQVEESEAKSDAPKKRSRAPKKSSD